MLSRVALIGENSVGYIHALLDIWNNGDCAVLIDWRVPFETAIEMMKEANVEKCYIGVGLYSEIRDEAYNKVLFVRYEQVSLKAELLPSSTYDKFKENYSREEAVVIYSSGTTGKSKGIVLSHYAINTNADAIIDYMKPASNDCIYICKTLSHSSTLVGELLVALKTGTKLLISPIIVPPRCVLNNIEKYGVTVLCTNPTLLSLYTDTYNPSKFNLSSLRTIYVSGSILNDKVYRKAHSAFVNVPIYNVYGLSEAGPRVTAQKASCNRSNSVGTAIKSVQVSIVDDEGTLLSANQRGYIHVKTPSIFNGYVKGETKHPSKYKDWLNTGDVGFWDENGELHVIGRSDDVINIDAHKIYPQDIEAAIYRVSAIKECVVTAVEYDNDPVLCCAYVSETDISVDIRKKLGEVLLRYEIPKRFVRVDKLPKTRTGKTQVAEVQRMLKDKFKR